MPTDRPKIAEVKVSPPSPTLLCSPTGAGIWAAGSPDPTREGSSAQAEAKAHQTSHVICL